MLAWRGAMIVHPSGLVAKFSLAGDSATFSKDETYRYFLSRVIDPSIDRWCAFLLLNPSTAGEFKNDPTVSRCIKFAKRWGFGHLIVWNLYAIRSPHPRILREVHDPVGPLNDDYLEQVARAAELVVCAWGNHADKWRVYFALKILNQVGVTPYCLGVTNSHAPLHPLARGKAFIPYDRRLREYHGPQAGSEGAYWKGQP